MSRSASTLETREKILDAAFHEIRHNGFRAASLDQILEKTSVTKGALYHYFPNKLDLGYAVLEERIRPDVTKRWLEPLQKCADPIEELIHIIQKLPSEPLMQCGCPLNNLAQEMSPVDDPFRQKMDHLFDDWIQSLTAFFKTAQENGQMKKSLDAPQAAFFLVAAIEGTAGLVKNSQSTKTLKVCQKGLVQYLRSLKP